MNTTLFKKTSTGKVQIWRLEINKTGDAYRTVSGQKDGKLVTSEWTTVKGKNVGRSNETTATEQCRLEVEARYTKQLAQGGYHTSESNIHEDKFFKVMLAKDYNDHFDNYLFLGDVFSQPKLDGMRCVLTPEGEYSRGGKRIPAVDFLYKDVYPKLVKLLGKNVGVIDGELYSHEFRDDFNKIISLCKKQKPTDAERKETEQNIQYWIYDIALNLPYALRLKILADAIETLNDDRIKLVPTHQVATQTGLDELYEEYLSQGYEGQIVRIGFGGYQNKRTDKLLKRKEFQDEEFVIRDIMEGKGNRTGMAGHMVFETKNGKSFHSNIMGTRDMLREYLKNKSKYIGSQATVVYFNLTPDGIPRFPRVKVVYDGKRNL
jgi:DNA ligase-1